MADFEAYITRAGLQKCFGVSTRTVARWIRNGCPCIRTGPNGRGDPRFRFSKVEAWLDAQAEVAKR